MLGCLTTGSLSGSFVAGQCKMISIILLKVAQHTPMVVSADGTVCPVKMKIKKKVFGKSAIVKSVNVTFDLNVIFVTQTF